MNDPLRERGDDLPDRREKHEELWKAINLSREKIHEDAKFLTALMYRVDKLEDWKEDQERESLKQGKELAQIEVHLKHIADAEQRREQRERQSELQDKQAEVQREQREQARVKQIIAIISLIMTGVSILSSLIVFFITKSGGAK